MAESPRRIFLDSGEQTEEKQDLKRGEDFGERGCDAEVLVGRFK